MQFTAYIEKDAESGMYIGIVPALTGAHTYAETIDELQVRLQEVVELCLEDMEYDERSSLPRFAGITQLEVAV
ncbi:HicB family protein [Planctomycetales bacterium]|nr:HicB family protein [Planctomycetales bacterium]GHT44706.1 HicB family protein [Planctomycetales bacterium]